MSVLTRHWVACYLIFTDKQQYFPYFSFSFPCFACYTESPKDKYIGLCVPCLANSPWVVWLCSVVQIRPGHTVSSSLLFHPMRYSRNYHSFPRDLSRLLFQEAGLLKRRVWKNVFPCFRVHRLNSKQLKRVRLSFKWPSINPGSQFHCVTVVNWVFKVIKKMIDIVIAGLPNLLNRLIVPIS